MAPSQYPRGSEAEKYALRWVTIGRRGSGDERSGGFPVQIDDDGKIVGGKRAESLGLHNTHVSDVKEHFDERRAIQSSDDDGDFSFDFGDESTASKRKAAAKELPAKRTQIRERLIDAAGDDERDQASLYDRMKAIVAAKADEVRDFNDQLDEFHGSKTTERKLSLIGKLRKRSDPSKVEGFDELLQEARNYYPALLRDPDGGNDEEYALAEAVRGGKRRVPTIMDDEVLDEALRGWEPVSDYEPEYANDMDAVPFSRGSEAEKYFRRWNMPVDRYANDGERWITINPSGAEGAGRPVKIDKDGKIVGGSVPGNLRGTHIGDLGKNAKESKRLEKAPAKAEKPAPKAESKAPEKPKAEARPETKSGGLSRMFKSDIDGFMKEDGGFAFVRGVTPEQAAELAGGKAFDAGADFESNLRDVATRRKIPWETIEKAKTSDDPRYQQNLAFVVREAFEKTAKTINETDDALAIHGLDGVAKDYPSLKDELPKLNGWNMRDYRKGKSALFVSESIDPPAGRRAKVNSQKDVEAESRAVSETAATHERLSREKADRERQAEEEKQRPAREARARDEAASAKFRSESLSDMAGMLDRGRFSDDLKQKMIAGKLTKAARKDIANSLMIAANHRRDDLANEAIDAFIGRLKEPAKANYARGSEAEKYARRWST